jgi:hypothetical protein
MKCFTTILLGSLLLALSSGFPERNGETLTEVIDRIIESFDDLQSWSCFAQLETIDRECLDERLNVKDNGEKIVDKETAVVTILPAISLCVDSQRDLLHAFIQTMTAIMFTMNTDHWDCFKLKLQKIEPNATILEGFDADSMEVNSDECENAMNINGMINEFERKFGDIDEASCGTLTVDGVKSFFLKIRILKNGGLRKALAKSEKAKLIDILSVKVENFVKCRVGKL